MKRNKLTAILASVLAASTLLSGMTMTAAADEPTTVEYMFWGNQEEINTIMATIDRFNETHEDVQVKGIGLDSSVYLEKLSAYIASNTMPDIVQVAVDYGDEYNKKEIFEPLDSMIDEAGLRELVGDNLWKGLSYNDSIYAVPQTASGLMLVGNKTLFEEAGVEWPEGSWTEEEFKEAAIKLTNAEEKQYGMLFGGWLPYYMIAPYGSETQIYDWDAKTMNAVGNEAVKHFLELTISDIMFAEQAAPAVATTTDLGGRFETGKYGMELIGYWNLPSFDKVIEDSFEWDLLPLPTSEEYGQWTTEIYANALSISASSEKKEAAFEYLKWVLEDEEVQTSSAMLPVNKNIAESEEFLTTFDEDDVVFDRQLALDALNNGVDWRNTGVIAEINDNIVVQEIEQLIVKPDSTDIDTVLENIQTKGQKLFDTSK